MSVRKTTPEEARRVNELFAICFETPYTNCPADPENDDGTHWAAFDDNGEMMSTFTISDYTIRFDGNRCKMGGIGGVATLPQYRRRGGIRACFREALPDMYRSGYDFSYLYPFSTAYYRKFGYENCVRKYFWTVDLSLLKLPKGDGSFRLAEKGRPMTEEIQKIDKTWESAFNMMVLHKAEDYDWAEKCDPAVKQEFTYVCFDAAGTPNAYTTFRLANEPDGRNLVCSRFCFGDKAGFEELMRLFQSLASDHRFVKFTTPAIPALQYFMPEWSLGAARWSIQPAGMVRVVNVCSVLEKARYSGSGSVCLEVRDDQIPENNGSFTVTFAEGRAVRVERGGEPDAIMTIPTFSALIAGVSGFAGAKAAFPGLEVKKENPCLAQVFFRKPMMIADYF